MNVSRLAVSCTGIHNSKDSRQPTLLRNLAPAVPPSALNNVRSTGSRYPYMRDVMFYV